jgi:hypothetical protein
MRRAGELVSTVRAMEAGGKDRPACFLAHSWHPTLMQFPDTLTPDEGVILLLLGLLTLLACLGFAIWFVVN